MPAVEGCVGKGEHLFLAAMNMEGVGDQGRVCGVLFSGSISDRQRRQVCIRGLTSDSSQQSRPA